MYIRVHIHVQVHDFVTDKKCCGYTRSRILNKCTCTYYNVHVHNFMLITAISLLIVKGWRMLKISRIYELFFITNTCMTIPTKLLVGWGLIARVATSALSNVWKNKGICLKTKLRLLHYLIISIALYRSESWVLEERDKEKIENFELHVWCYRCVHVFGIS